MLKIQNSRSEIETALDYIETEFKKLKISRRDYTATLLTAEEAIVCLMEHAPKEAQIEILFRRRFGNVNLLIAAAGEEFDITETPAFPGGADTDEENTDMEHAIRGLILRARSDTFQYRNKAHRNTIRISVKSSDRIQLYLTLGALLLSVVLGTLFKIILPSEAQNTLDTCLLDPVRTVFLNALKMIIGPVVFFSIVSCLSQFDDLRDLGKIGAKVMGMYLLTTLLAVLVGCGVFTVLSPGNTVLTGMVTDAADATIATAEATEISILDTIINIVPDNFVQPFLDADMLQIIFMAILCGAAVGMIGDYSKLLKSFFDACNALFLKITTLIVKVIPLAVLCSMTSLVMLTGNDTLLAIAGFFGTFIAALAVMVCIYALLVLVIGRLNPLHFLKKHAPVMLTNFSLASSNAAMPFNIRSCTNLGIPSKICSFSIPLGATLNMDGSCIYMAVAGLFLAKVFGVDLGPSKLFSMIFSIIVLSIGAPGIPGSGLVCLSVLLVQIGVPAEALSLIMGIDSILGMFRVAVNSTGDVAVSLIVAKTEKMLDIDKYRAD
ncbi:MAG: dicarboxylate/amino acid:cation symporter [Lachnospiraceae bacterium]|nr:dicarboxylate/amino acid:cation symporter [Lachnospiraceae bacterium]